MRKAWVNCYVGLPWEAYATGPDAYDCWGLVVHVSREHYGLVFDRHLGTQTNNGRAIHRTIGREIETGKWSQIDSPCDGAVVLLSLSRKFHHIGVWLDVDGGVLLHSFEGSGVCLSTLSELQDMGFQRIDFYQALRDKFDG